MKTCVLLRCCFVCVGFVFGVCCVTAGLSACVCLLCLKAVGFARLCVSRCVCVICCNIQIVLFG